MLDAPDQATWRPEVLAPAGDLWRLRTAVAFGADAIYIGGPHFGLRKNADNFTPDEMALAIEHAHSHGRKVYVTCNIHPLRRDWQDLLSYAKTLQQLQPDAVIVADPGVAAVLHGEAGLRLHVSTQASVLNSHSAALWKQRGASRIVVGRELSLHDAAAVRESSGAEVECFVHGAMCASFSGKCVISNYTAGRDANRGGCVQTCRNAFTMHAGRDTNSTVSTTAATMNAKDLYGMPVLQEFYHRRIDAAKIEGRMKSALYVAATVAAYRRGLDNLAQNGDQNGDNDQHTANPAAHLLPLLTNRGSSDGGLSQRPFRDSLGLQFDNSPSAVITIGQAVHSDTGASLVHLKQPLRRGQTISALTPNGDQHTWTIEDLRDSGGTARDLARQESCAWVSGPAGVSLPTFTVFWTLRDNRSGGQ